MPQNYFNMPNPQQTEILRRQKMAQLLQQQAMQPIEAPPTPAGGFAAPISPLQVAAKVMQGYKGNQLEKQAGTQQQQLAVQMQAERQQALAKALQQAGGSPQPAPDLGGGPAMPPDPMGAAGTLAGSKDPMLAQVGMGMVGKGFENMLPQRPKAPEPFTLSPGATRYGPQGQPIASQPAAQPQPPAPAPFTLSPGGTRFDAQGNPVASLPPTPQQPQKPPPGYRVTTAGDLEAIPGGPADMKLRGQFNQDTGILQASTSGLDRLGAEANALLKHPGLSKSTGLMSVVPGVGGLASIPGTDAANFKARLDTLKSQVGFSVLQEMRNNSKTGGALGQVSDRENVMLQNNLAALDRAQSEPEFKEALKRIVDYTDAAKDRLRSAFNLKHGDVQEPSTPQRRSTDKPRGTLTQQEKQELEALRKRFGR